ARDADLIIVEGVMGLFDGTPSAADLARRFGLPVLAVIDASAMATTFGALAFGLQHYQPGLRWAGVLANRVAGARHAELLQAGLLLHLRGQPRLPAPARRDVGVLLAIGRRPAAALRRGLATRRLPGAARIGAGRPHRATRGAGAACGGRAAGVGRMRRHDVSL